MRSLAKAMSALVFFGGVALIHADNAPATPVPPAAGPVSSVPTLSPAEMQSRAEATMTEIAADSAKMNQLREQARKLKDVIKLNCVNDKLVEAHAQQNIADQANEALLGAIARNSDDRNIQFQALNDSAASIKTLREGAAACIGIPELTKQESGADVVRPDIPDNPQGDDPYFPTNGQGGPVVIEPPGYASAPH